MGYRLRRLFERAPDVNKYDFGHVLIVGGSHGMVGASVLAGTAALRTGAGLVTIAAPADVAYELEGNTKEIMTLALPNQPDKATREIIAFIKDRHVTTVVVGPGLHGDVQTTLCQLLLKKLQLPVVIDAGGLAALKGRLDDLQQIAHQAPVILTPHTGEYEKLTFNELPESENQTTSVVSAFAQKLGLTVVLKGARTLVAHPDGATHRNTTGNPGLATAGTGDVLSGVIAGLLAQDIPVAEAAEAGVYLHGLAGDLAEAAKTEPGMIASDVIDFLPDALKQLSDV